MTNVRTSTSSPLGLSLLPSPLPGKVGLTIAPGKHTTSKSGAPWARDLGADLDRLVHTHQIEVLVCLLEEHELHRLRIPDLIPEAERRGLTVLRLQIPDGGVLPSHEPVERLVRAIDEAAAAGKNVAIHCNGGLGRSGTVGGCWLVERGATAEEALATLREVRGRNCPETQGQKQFIVKYAERQARLTAPSSLEDRVKGAVLGAAIGDAMGHPTEFLGMDAIRLEYGPDGVQGFELYWGEGASRFAPYTDDTQMAEAVARGLLEAPEARADLDGTMRAIAERFIAWSNDPQGGHRAPGNACLAGCRALARGAAWHEAGGPTAGGCGSVMRAYPFGLRFHRDLTKAEAWAVAHSKLTHRDPIALAACAAMAVGVARALRGDPADMITSEMVAAACRYSPKTAGMMTRALDEAQAGVGPEVTLKRLEGWAAHEAIAAAVYIFARHPDDPRAAILEGANTPGDSDSLATLAGALTGARCGLSALPISWVKDVERSAELLELAAQIAQQC